MHRVVIGESMRHADMSELFYQSGPQKTQDREAVLAAVRTVSYADPDPLKPPKPFSQMSDVESFWPKPAYAPTHDGRGRVLSK